MSTNSRRGNRTSTPSLNPSGRPGFRRSNTPPPPSVRLGIDGLPERSEASPFSTSRPRGHEEGEGVPALANPPADVVAAAARRAAPPTPTAKAPAVVPSAPELPHAVAANDAATSGPGRKRRDTLPSKPESAPPAAASDPSVGPDDEEARASLSDGAPAVQSRKSNTGASTAPGAVKRKGRGSNKRTSKATPAPAEVAQDAETAPVAGRKAATAKAEVAVSAHSREPEKSPPFEDERESGGEPALAPDLDQHFFDHGERASAAALEAHEDPDDDPFDDHVDEKMALKNSPAAIARREQNASVVWWGGGFCVLLVLVGLVRSSRSSHVDAPVNEGAVANGSVPTANAQPSLIAVPVPADDPAAPVARANPGSAGPLAAGNGPAGSAVPNTPPANAPVVAKTDEGPAVVPGPAAEPTEGDKKDAVKEKKACEAFLNRGAFAKAVEAGEHSVALDPADGDAWLMLGAAYQSLGKMAEARRSFSSCVAEGKKGSLTECRQMLR